MDDERLLARLGRIDALDRSGAAAGALLEELRGLVRDAEELARVRTVQERDGEEVVGRLRTAPHGT
jgi:hypothetical protein